MKKQLKPNIKAHLLRGAFYLLLLVTVCAIPFALAQRHTAKRNVAKSNTVATAPASVSALDGTVSVSQPNPAQLRTKRRAPAV